MEIEKLNLLLVEYHNFCIDLINKLKEEYTSDDRYIQKAFRFRDDIETEVLELQIKSKEGGRSYYANEIEQLKLKIKSMEDRNTFNDEN